MTEDNLYQQLAELKLQNRLLEDRLKMMTRMCNNYAEQRVDLCRQLEQVGMVITTNNEVVRKTGA